MKMRSHVFRDNGRDPFSIFVNKAGDYFWASAYGYMLADDKYEKELKQHPVSLEEIIENPQWWVYPEYYTALIISLT